MTKLEKPTSGDRGNNLIFIISQPRSGSTLLQAIIGKHPRIKTIPEPWLLLPLLSIRRPGAHIADYNADAAKKAIDALVAHLPDQDTYQEGIRRFVLHLYGSLTQSDDSQYFLDKTPRYYFIIPEIREVFSDALIILLFRNPLAVLCSLISRHDKGWIVLGQTECDLLIAPEKLSIAQSEEKRTIILHYENYINSPEILSQIFEALDLTPPLDLTTYDAKETLINKGFSGDRNVEQFTNIQRTNDDKWIQMLKDPQVWRLCQDYLDRLGSPLVRELGYDFDELQAVLDEHRPGLWGRICTLSLQWFFNHKEPTAAKWHPAYIVFFVFRLLFFNTHQNYNLKEKLQQHPDQQVSN